MEEKETEIARLTKSNDHYYNEALRQADKTDKLKKRVKELEAKLSEAGKFIDSFHEYATVTCKGYYAFNPLIEEYNKMAKAMQEI